MIVRFSRLDHCTPNEPSAFRMRVARLVFFILYGGER